jgi:hypothetical protein
MAISVFAPDAPPKREKNFEAALEKLDAILGCAEQK